MRFQRPLSCIACIVPVLAAPSAARAAASVCEDPADQSFAAIAWSGHEHSSLDERAGSTNLENQEFDVHVTSASGRFAWGVAHRYLIFDFAGIEPQTNGHVHTTFAPLHWTFEGKRTSFVYEAVALEWSVDWRVHPRLTLSLEVGRQLDNRYEMTLANGERVTVSGEPANRTGFGIRWRF